MAVSKQRATKVVVTMNAPLRKLWREAKHRLDKATSEDAHAWDARFEALDEILAHEPPLYLAGGFSNDRDFLKSLGHEDPSTLRRAMRVARHASPDEIERYGQTTLDLAMSLLEVENGGPLKVRSPVAFEKLRFKLMQKGKVTTKRFSDMTAVELHAAIALARGREATSKKASPVAKAVAQALAKGGVKGATFTVSRQGVVLHVPLEVITKLGAALAKYVAPPK